MAHIAGKYQFVENKNIDEFLAGIGVSGDDAQAISQGKEGLEVKVDGNKIALIHEGPQGTSDITVGGEFEQNLPNGKVLKSVAELNGSVLKVTSKTKEGESAGTRTYTFTDSGLEVAANIPRNGKTYSATRIYKRV